MQNNITEGRERPPYPGAAAAGRRQPERAGPGAGVVASVNTTEGSAIARTLVKTGDKVTVATSGAVVRLSDGLILSDEVNHDQLDAWAELAKLTGGTREVAD